MNTQNLFRPEDSVSSVEARESLLWEIGFQKFLKEFDIVSENNLTSDEILEQAKRRWYKLSDEQRMQFLPARRNLALNQRSVAGDRLLEAPGPVDTAISDTAFHNFMESFTIKLSHKAAKKWELMSERERAAYAAKEDIASCNSVSSYAVDCENGPDPLSSRMINEVFGCSGEKKMKRKMKCARPAKKCRKSKPKCSRPKPKCSKPKPKCSRPKRRSCKPKPKCAKPKSPCMLNN